MPQTKRRLSPRSPKPSGGSGGRSADAGPDNGARVARLRAHDGVSVERLQPAV